ncbi:peptidoglycan editing factor PgeF [Proteiniborus sp.]|uniref:peptidoglycan editing factor PgeF n=1 Tax=Proteiniborus sp. TaxID=2079015 RepID=UPI0033296F85
MNENIGFELREVNRLQYYIIPSFEQTGLVKHGFTTRFGGLSPKPFNTLNLGLKTEDDKENIMKNFERVSNAFNVSMEKMVLSDQVHDTVIRIVTEEDAGKGLTKSMDYSKVDGLLTNVNDLMLLTFYADCVPLFFLDKTKKVIGVAHAGWKGTVARIGEKMVKTMQKVFCSNPEDILVGIGPSIGSCCYPVRKDVYDKFHTNLSSIEEVLLKESTDVWKLDLWKANQNILEENGILSRNITVSGLCTSCYNEKFFSYRKENGRTGRMAALIQLV